MVVRDISRMAVDTWFRLGRLPIDAAARLLPDGDGGPRPAASLFIDKADAAAREALGGLLGDTELQEDARRRRAAAEERAHAMNLRLVAEQKKTEADKKFAADQELAERRRVEAQRAATARKADVERERVQKEREAAAVAAKQEQAVEKQRQASLAAADKKAKQQRLTVLDAQADALDQQETALTVEDEALRLRKAAAKAKAARKA